MKKVLSFSVWNTTEKPLMASMLDVFEKNEGIEKKFWHTSLESDDYLISFKNWIIKNQLEIELFRIQFQTNGEFKEFNKDVIFKPFIYVGGNPFGSRMERLMFYLCENMSPHQQQVGIIDIKADVLIDGVSTDIHFEMLPKENITITIFLKEEEELKNEVLHDYSTIIHSSEISETLQKHFEEYDKQQNEWREKNGIILESEFRLEYENHLNIFSGNPFDGHHIFLENNSDEEMVVDLFDYQSYVDLVEKTTDIYVYDRLGGKDKFGKRAELYGKDENISEYDYLLNISRIIKENLQYDCFRIVNPSRSELSDITVNGLFIEKGKIKNKYMNENHVITDVVLKDKMSFNSFKYKIPANTKILFIFGIEDRIRNAKTISCRPAKI